MLVRVKRLLNTKFDLAEVKLFLSSCFGIEELNECKSFYPLLEQLQRSHIDVFNISILDDLATSFDENDKSLTEVIKSYKREKNEFLNQTTIQEYSKAVRVSRPKPSTPNRMDIVSFKITEMSCHKTLRDIEMVAIEGFEGCYKKFICLHAEASTNIISWAFPEELSVRLENLAQENANIFESNDVLEVTVAGKIAFSKV